MPKMKEHRAVGEDYFSDAPHVVTNEQDIEVSATTLFTSLAGTHDWKQWLGLDVAYTSEPATGVGTTRTVTKGPVTIEEYFFIWEPGERLAFRAERSSLPVGAFAEDYVITRTGSDSCRLAWTIALEGKPGLVGRPIAFAMKRQGDKTLPNLARLLESR